MSVRRVFIDMDGVLVDFDGYAKTQGLPSEVVKRQPGTYRAMAPLPGALAAVCDLLAQGFEVWIASKPPTGVTQAYADKVAWIQQHLPDLVSRIILTHDKGLLGGSDDILCDDRPHKANCAAFPGKLLCFEHGYHWPEALAELVALAQGAAAPVSETAARLNFISLRLTCLRDPHWAAAEIARLRELVDPRVLVSQYARYTERR